ncbi:MAG: hypothetical protein UU88_C0001G0002 [Parcubacteria group bacterium GW2011_GWC1_42_11]|uniref:Outer membrane protein OmpA-like transmembrane domain-containing protein n=1 Tax=Candidatus Nomurabacteria bacterium GW2011_GWC2_42_20 TaxID=1618756 RepID=A0A0G1BP52_9BACT|nr:MAG: hypothetical protein UU88_C0001G0002 [Parcubacteria group bacterium GW2011_GWC1_42_11]KKS48066.1 MAG: hypothetical protein UV12_C0003G0025 [Candidatus Nomurabacteria bacterium GW2011_GWC2_42_20]KKS59296.1 MAG: hypothetical protein UV24_C0003G0026 [Candidatus Nomurabacteria bacterium GW2011_GWA2_42_41]KKT09606.1 MAG: hypothetical protein UV86_C0004G0025 [Candidatus Nomurabacteria bacterium GW2011_GWB1_43_20]TAN36482.1 MAG: hypothetical protein EPN27_01720 [Patescibacteria group bacterium
MKQYLIGILILALPIYGYAEGYLPNSVKIGIIDSLEAESLEKEQRITNSSEGVNSSIIKTDFYTKNHREYADMRARREMLLSAIQLSVTKKISVDDELDVFGRVGVYNYQIEALARRHSSRNNLSFPWGSVGRETAPIASIGIEAKPFQHFSFRAEYQRAGSATSSSLSVLYKFE